jgi:uncharacterized membrane protein YfcA
MIVAVSVLDVRALRAGGSVALVFAVPFAALATWLNGRDDESPLVPWLVLAALAGFVLGAGVAAWTQTRGLPLMHGIVCAVATYTAAQTVFIIVKLMRGGDVGWVPALFNLTASAFAGLIGGGLGAIMHSRGLRPSRPPEERR